MSKRNQANEIYDFILAHGPVSVSGIRDGTGWHEYVIELAIKLMLESSLIEQAGTDAHGTPTYAYKRRYGALLAEVERLEQEAVKAPPRAPAAQPLSRATYIPPNQVLTDEQVQACAEAAIRAGLAGDTLPPVDALMSLVTTDWQSIERVKAAIWSQREHLPWQNPGESSLPARREQANERQDETFPRFR